MATISQHDLRVRECLGCARCALALCDRCRCPMHLVLSAGGGCRAWRPQVLRSGQGRRRGSVRHPRRRGESEECTRGGQDRVWWPGAHVLCDGRCATITPPLARTEVPIHNLIIATPQATMRRCTGTRWTSSTACAGRTCAAERTRRPTDVVDAAAGAVGEAGAAAAAVATATTSASAVTTVAARTRARQHGRNRRAHERSGKLSRCVYACVCGASWIITMQILILSTKNTYNFIEYHTYNFNFIKYVQLCCMLVWGNHGALPRSTCACIPSSFHGSTCTRARSAEAATVAQGRHVGAALVSSTATTVTASAATTAVARTALCERDDRRGVR